MSSGRWAFVFPRDWSTNRLPDRFGQSPNIVKGGIERRRRYPDSVGLPPICYDPDLRQRVEGVAGTGKDAERKLCAALLGVRGRDQIHSVTEVRRNDCLEVGG